MSAEDSHMSSEIQSAVGRKRVVTDDLHSRPAEFLAASLDMVSVLANARGDLPHGWHWIYFLDAPPTADVGADGRSVPGGFLPETGLSRRMWAGGELTFHRPLRLGQPAQSEAKIEAIEEKLGRSGRLVFLDVRYRISDNDGPAIEERRDIVMREAAKPGETAKRLEPPGAALWRRELTPSHLLLFRFSALTFNSHRIHYDADYVRETEGYPDLLVHGPLMALLLLNLAASSCPNAAIRRFSYRAVAPQFVGRPLALCGRPAGDGLSELWVESEDGALAMTAEVEHV